MLSTDRLAIIDPHEKYFKYNGQGTTGYSWNLKQRQQDLAKIHHQLLPFINKFGCNKDTFRHGLYRGTMFHFPLRQKPSELSDTVYSSSKMMELFKSFEADAHLVLLFLKYVEKVELLVQHAGQAEPTVQFQVHVAADCAHQVRSMRKQFMQSIDIDRWMSQPATVTYPLFIECIRYEAGAEPVKIVHRWLISEYYAGGEASIHLKTLCKDAILSHIPLVGVAMPLETTLKKHKEQEEDESECSDANGHVFCFLPLPVEQKSSTGLPVHVNGYFAISQNRRHLKWPTAGQNIRGDKSVLWNQLLLREVIPKCYMQLILQAIQLSEANKIMVKPFDIFSAMPNVIDVDEKWQLMMEPFYSELLCHKIFFTSCKGGKWIIANESVFDCLKETEEIAAIIKSVLLHGGVNIVEIPRHILHAMGAFSSYSPEIISPTLMRYVLRDKPQVYTSMPRDIKITLLGYILKDHDFPDLDRIQLLPLADGTFTMFRCGAGRSNKVYITSEQHPASVMLGQQNCLLAENLPENIKGKLQKLASSGRQTLKSLL